MTHILVFIVGAISGLCATLLIACCKDSRRPLFEGDLANNARKNLISDTPPRYRERMTAEQLRAMLN